MKYNDVPSLYAMTREQAQKTCAELGIKVEFHSLSNGRYDFPCQRVVRYKIEKKESGEVLVCDITGFPTLNYEQKK